VAKAFYQLDPAAPDGIARAHPPAVEPEGEGWVLGPWLGRKNRDTGLWPVKAVNGRVVAKTAPTPAEALALAQKRAYARLASDYDGYVKGRRYTNAWRGTAQAQRAMLKEVIADPKATAKQKAAAQAAEARFQALEEFLLVTLLLYFGQVGQQIFAAASLAELEAVTWDFSQFDDQDPGVTMHGDIIPAVAVAKGGA
jgi:hypothetical protein